MRALIWIMAIGLAVGPLVLVKAMGRSQGVSSVGPVMAVDGPVGASTDDAAVARVGGGVEASAGGSVAQSVGWTVAAGALVLALWGGLALGEASVGNAAAEVAAVRSGGSRWLRSGWFAVTGAARWESTASAVRSGSVE